MNIEVELGEYESILLALSEASTHADQLADHWNQRQDMDTAAFYRTKAKRWTELIDVLLKQRR